MSEETGGDDVPRMRTTSAKKLLLGLVEPLAAVIGAAVRRHPLVLPPDILEASSSRLLDLINLQIHLSVLVVRNSFQQRAVARPVRAVLGAPPGEWVGAPIDSGSGTCGHGTPEGLLLAAGGRSLLLAKALYR